MIETICDGLMILGVTVLVSMLILSGIQEIRKNKQERQKATKQWQGLLDTLNQYIDEA